MSKPPIITAGPSIESDVPSNVRRHLQLIYQKLGNHTQAFSILADKSSGPTTTTAPSSSGSNASGGGSTTGSVAGIPVNNQSGVTSYYTTVFDNGGMIVFSDSSPVSVTLVSSVPPYGFFVANQGAGTVTLTPSSGTINGASTFSVTSNHLTIVAFDGTNWWASTQSIVPVTFAAVAHEWLNSYNAATGAWTAAQPSFTDISGVAASSQLPNPTTSALGGVEAISPVSHQWVNSINTSGIPQLSQPAFTDVSGTATVAQGGTGTASPALVAGTNVTITGSWPNQTINSSTTGLSVTITTAKLTTLGTNGSMTFTAGLLTSQVAAT